MKNYLKEAQAHAELIDHYYSDAGTFGYAQALHHEQKLGKLMGEAHRSTRGKQYVPVILAILENVRPKLDEMKRRESESDAR